MTKVFLIITLVSCAHMAHAGNRGAIKIHYENVLMEDNFGTLRSETKNAYLSILDDVLYVPGPVIIRENDTRSKKQKHIDVVKADQVEISDDSNPAVIKADKLEFDNGTKRGELTGHIIAIRNGVGTCLGEHADICFTKNEFTITNIR